LGGRRSYFVRIKAERNVPSEATLESFIKLVESNQHVEAIERFYTEDASMQENHDTPRKGRALLAEREAAFLKNWAKVESHCVRPAFRSGDHVVIRWNFEFTAPDGSSRKMDELAYQRWQGEKIAEERFYYDPKHVLG
jgi:ketosteroid isomerase-like protein